MQKELVILIHGTFDWEEHDTENGKEFNPKTNENEPKPANWWQTNSSFSQYLESELGDNFQVKRFKWPYGDNLESSRINGAKTLTKLIISLEEDNINYHIIGYSHGGSVAWKALWKVASLYAVNEYDEQPLSYLKSVTTVATPFFKEFNSKKRTKPFNKHLRKLLTGFTIFVITCLVIIYQLPILSQVPTFLLPTIIIISITYCIYETFKLLIIKLKQTYSVPTFPISKLIHNKVLILKTEHDEAFKAIQQSFKIPKTPVLWLESKEPKRTHSDKITSIFENIEMPKEVLTYWFTKFIVNPAITLIAWYRIRSTAKNIIQGDNRILGDFKSVSTTPSTFFKDKPDLPDFIIQDIIKKADAQASKSFTRIREMIASPIDNFILSKDNLNNVFTMKELIHNNYFDSEFIRELLVLHIKENSDSDSPSGTSNETLNWYKQSFKPHTSSDVLQDYINKQETKYKEWPDRLTRIQDIAQNEIEKSSKKDWSEFL